MPVLTAIEAAGLQEDVLVTSESEELQPESEPSSSSPAPPEETQFSPISRT